MSDTHSRQVEAGVSMTMLVARRVKQQLEGKEMEQPVGKLKKGMEGCIREEETCKEGGKVLMEGEHGGGGEAKLVEGAGGNSPCK